MDIQYYRFSRPFSLRFPHAQPPAYRGKKWSDEYLMELSLTRVVRWAQSQLNMTNILHNFSKSPFKWSEQFVSAFNQIHCSSNLNEKLCSHMNNATLFIYDSCFDLVVCFFVGFFFGWQMMENCPSTNSKPTSLMESWPPRSWRSFFTQLTPTTQSQLLHFVPFFDISEMWH